MGIKKDETLPNGVPLSYYRIVSLTTVVNQQTVIELAGYVSEDARQTEQAAQAEAQETGEYPDTDVYIDTRYIVVGYDPEMSVTKAYEYLKSLPEWEDAEDVVDEWQAGASYYVGDVFMYDGVEYECIQSHTSQVGWEPPNAPSLWKVHKKEGDIPEWVQPTGAHDAYSIGDKVRHNGQVWVSEIDANTYEPGVYGWELEGGE